MGLIGGAEGDRTPGLRIANRTTGKTLSICLFESCSHQEISRVFPFFPIPYHRVYVTSCFFWPRIGHLEFADHRLLGSRFSSRCRLILFDDSMTRNLHDAMHVISDLPPNRIQDLTLELTQESIIGVVEQTEFRIGELATRTGVSIDAVR